MVSDMKKILYLPFLTIPSGHHQTADALMEGLLRLDPDIHCEKMDLLSSKFGKIERLISSFYLQWIGRFPKSYSHMYHRSVLAEQNSGKRFFHYEALFLRHLKKIIDELNPKMIVCTHALPSYLLARLKASSQINIPVINVYTDFFIHHLWGKREIDYHFVGHSYMKDYLLEKGIKKEQIFVTGIPIHPNFTKRKDEHVHSMRFYRGLISGGSSGVGSIEKITEKISRDDDIHYMVLCGKNRKLYDRLIKQNHPRITPLPYISSREQMNDLYNRVDFIMTKPGGVTISECLYKKIPIFVYHTLPGQEEINLEKLTKFGMVFDFRNWQEETNISASIIRALQSKQLSKFLSKVDEYHKSLAPIEPAGLIKRLMNE